MLTPLLVVSFLTLTPAVAHAPTCPSWEPMIRKAGLPVSEFSRIMWAESRCDPAAVGHNVNARDDIGLLQVNASWSTLTKQTCNTRKRPETALLSPACNLKVAKRLFSISGFEPWKSTYKKEKK